jgi:hypothetical protein
MEDGRRRSRARTARQRVRRSQRAAQRSGQLSALADALDGVRSTSHGRLVFIAGDAGVGKTALVRRFCDSRRGSARILSGACDALFTPRPLGPLIDIAEATGGGLQELVGSGARPHQLAAALVRELGTRASTIVVLEDLHWADEATLDVAEADRAPGRGGVRSPARQLSGRGVRSGGSAADRARGARDRLRDRSRSVGSVVVGCRGAVAEPHDVDVEELYRKTAGNPFFVTEALASGTDEVPHVVRDAVLARVARVCPAARTVLEAVAVVRPSAELWLLKGLVGDGVDYLDECLASGMLIDAAGASAAS